jgi:succinate dehydrogenase/fumarate reductase flavoprotein subunit
VEELTSDILIAGGGVAGLRAALTAARSGRSVLLVQRGAAASPFLRAVNVAFSSGPAWDRPPALFADMMLGGGFINEPGLVALCSHCSEAEFRYCEKLGVPFVRQNGELARRQAAGSSAPHAVYTRESIGTDMMTKMSEQIAAQSGHIRTLNEASLLRLLKGDGRVAGGLVWDDGERRWLSVRAKAVVLATGGASNLYDFTTQPPKNLGEGYSMALEAGAELVDMEFVCYEPFVTPRPYGGQIIATTLLTENAILRNAKMEIFLDTSGAPPKDIISRAIFREAAEGRALPEGTVYYDLRSVSEKDLMGYPKVLRTLKALGLEHKDALVPVAPAFHYLSGGIRVDGDCRSSLAGLFAAGEVGGGVHGAHRIAGSAGTDVLVTGAKAGESAAAYVSGLTAAPKVCEAMPSEASLESLRRIGEEEATVLTAVRKAMDAGAGIERTAGSLRETLVVIEGALRKVPHHGQAARTLVLSKAIASAALAREESRGDHYRSDFPDRDDRKWLGNTVITGNAADGDVQLHFFRAGLAQRSRM